MSVGEARVAVLHEDRSAHHHEAGRTGRAVGLTHATVVWTSLVAGATAGALAKTAIAPLDRTKINFQISQKPYSWRAAGEFALRTVRTEGVVAMWRGNSATMARIVPYAAIQFTAHEQWKRVLDVDTPQTAQAQPVRHLVAGSLAGVTSQSATYPLDLARARMAVTNATEYRTLRAVFTKVVRDEGLRALYRGYPATVLGVIPYAGVSFFTYDTLKHKYLQYSGGAVQGPLVSMCCGGAAGALAQTASYPLDIVRRRMQTARHHHYHHQHHHHQHHADLDRPYRTIKDTITTVYRLEGWRGFFKGLSMNWLKGPIAVGISFATYDTIRSTLRDIAASLHT